MNFTQTKLKGLYIVEQKPNRDERGVFARIYCQDEFKKAGIKFANVQTSYSFTRREGTIRGIHYQNKPFEEDKLVVCIKGAVFDVAVDIRKNSKTYGQWLSLELSESNHNMLYLPKGFAHGYQTLQANSVLLYFMSEFYHPESAAGILWNDKILNIKWPLNNYYLSKKDKMWPLWEDHHVKN